MPTAHPSPAPSAPTPAPSLDAVLSAVGPRLRSLRQEKRRTLQEIAAETGLTASTVSRLETGRLKPTLEQLLPLARTYQVPLDDLVGAPETGDPRVHLRPFRRNGRTIIPLSRRPGGVQAYKILIPPTERRPPTLQQHDGYEWFYVLGGRVRLLLGDQETVLGPGEVAEFDTRVPHAFGPADTAPGDPLVEILSLFGPQGERAHVAARTTTAADGAARGEAGRVNDRPA